MDVYEFASYMEEAHRRWVLIGNTDNGLFIGLDLEGRIFAVKDGKVLNRVDTDSIFHRSDRNQFRNPGGDALWPGPEGTCFGYEYASGKWRVPPSISGAVWMVTKRTENHLEVEAEADLINSRGTGIPVLLQRSIDVENPSPAVLIQRVTEKITYLGTETLSSDQFLLIPWSLCQFDWSAGSYYQFPLSDPADVHDFYTPSENRRVIENGLCKISAVTNDRVQLAIGESVPWVEYVTQGFRVRRSIEGEITGRYADIADADPMSEPSNRGVKFSIYTDPSGFTELEACGGSPFTLEEGTETRVTIVTHFETDSSFKPSEER